MKTSKDPRHINRINIMKALFTWDFNQKQPPEDSQTVEIVDNLEKVDQLIVNSAPAWPIIKINKIDLAILRLATFELAIEKKAPIKVIVDEAVELAKEFGSNSSPSFVNGALGKLITDLSVKI